MNASRVKVVVLMLLLVIWTTRPASAYYNADMKRFLSADPIGIQGGLNFYIYGGDNPLAFIDPLGRFTIRVSWGSQVGLGAGAQSYTGWALGVNTAPDVPFMERLSLGKVSYAGGGPMLLGAASGGIEIGLNPDAQHVAELAGSALESGGGGSWPTLPLLNVGVAFTTPTPVPAYGSGSPHKTEIQVNVSFGVSAEVHMMPVATYVEVHPLFGEMGRLPAGHSPYAFMASPATTSEGAQPIGPPK